jgi:hypothetical protein
MPVGIDIGIALQCAASNLVLDITGLDTRGCMIGGF